MPMTADRPPAAWFAEAARWYIDAHQGCPWCHDRQCVFRLERGSRIEYYCSTCDFSACFDGDSGRHYFAAGETGLQVA
jgi:glutathionyl-hydroquinone reductase